MATKMETIKISQDRHGPTLRGGINGKMFSLTTGQNIEVEPEMVDHLRNSGVSLEEVAGGAGSKEGSAVPAPEDVKPSMLPRSLDDSGGDQPGDVTTAEAPVETEAGDTSIAEAARISDIRVAAERRIAGEVSPAERAGEGEQGTPKPDPLDHDGDGRKGGSKPRKAASNK